MGEKGVKMDKNLGKKWSESFLINRIDNIQQIPDAV